MAEDSYFEKAVTLLKRLIATPSFSNEEDMAADIWEDWLANQKAGDVKRFHNNVYVMPRSLDTNKPLLLLNSHMDTVRPVSSYTRDPFEAKIEDGRLYGLGSNDAGGAGVSLAVTYLKLKEETDLPFNMLLAISASEEKMGERGMRALLPHLKERNIYPDMALVGEPTDCKAAIAERGLVVCDVEVKGKAGHAARDEGENAIYRAIGDIEKIKKHKWEKESRTLGPIKSTVTVIEAGSQHNIIPDLCKYIVDIRTTDAYSNEETVQKLQEITDWSVFKARSTRIRASVLDENHPLAEASRRMHLETFISPTTSDMALMHDIPSIKIGPGKSERSHTADEYIRLDEIRQGIKTYEFFLKNLQP